MLFQKNIIKKYLALLEPENVRCAWEQYKSYFLNTEVQQNIITAIKQNPFISQTEITNELSLARETVNRNMKKLQEQGIITRVGADKNGHWEVIE